MKNVAVILAGGKGSRMGGEVPKQFLKVAGRTIIEHAILAFDTHPAIDEIAVVAAKEHLGIMEDILSGGGFSKVRRLLAGGRERYLSTLAAVEAYRGQECNFFVHDGARPGVSREIISACAEELERSAAVEVAVPATDTIVELAEDGKIARIPPRRLLMNAQTPQCFRLDILDRAFRLAAGDPDFLPTDDCSVVHKYLPEVAISVVRGDERNFKVTYKSDIDLLSKLITDKQEPTCRTSEPTP